MSHTERPQGAGRPAEGPDSVQQTRPTGTGRPGSSGAVRRFRFTVLEGPQPGQSKDSNADTFSIGSHGLNDFVIEEPTVSRFHCEVKVDHDGARLRDLDSRNGTVLDGVHVRDAYLRGGSILRLGRVSVRFDFSPETNRLLISDRTTFGELVGSSPVTRASFALMERAAASDATVLLEGETGTGKSRAAFAIHQASARASGPFLTVDCGAIPGNLLESELFGHEKGSFTGAIQRRIGAFEEADGGTIFLDEIGELPAELQPKLLRVLENKEIRRLGANGYQPVNVRVIAATHRDLRAEVNAARFRSDLFFRLAVVRIIIPALRERPEDIPLIAERILTAFGAGSEQLAALSTPEFIAQLQHAAWPGNVRELRNHLERCLVFQDAMPPDADEVSAQAVLRSLVDPKQPYAEARRRALEVFEREYLDALLKLHGGKVSQAATAADMDRVYLYRLLRRHRLRT
ncbi:MULTISPECIES: sigma 54-interacting transcriptional regulator [Myxococcus]|uniref:sigma 54-interacting transcriptional regulator n=1 Tax=Myxococcus TaxID=32 RepID=UPI001129A785|nr:MULTISPECIES: sigma 54-interacting transcriptional regulator [Myxococcus]QDE84027.1 AAA family ATPase [Myxococcus xanthus]QDF05888.1 AAA family ATPase [Myxococcus xanthus]WAM23355.1 sigma 54-interacting transcriptional regulator [Myxococcus sp. NMCA1]